LVSSLLALPCVGGTLRWRDIRADACVSTFVGKLNLPDADELLARFRRPFRGMNVAPPVSEGVGALPLSIDLEVSSLAPWLIDAGCIRGFSVYLSFMGAKAVEHQKLHEFRDIGDLAHHTLISGLQPHYIIGLVVEATGMDGTSLGWGSRHEFYFVFPSSLDIAENGDETRIVNPNIGFDVPDAPACEAHRCRGSYRTDNFVELPSLIGELQAITRPTTMECAGGLCRIANGCIDSDHNIRYYRQSGSPTPIFIYSNHQARPASVTGTSYKPLLEHPLVDRAARFGIDQRVEGTTLLLSTGYANNIGHWNQFVIKLLALRRHVGLANISRVLVLMDPTSLMINETENLDRLEKPRVVKNGLYDLHLDLLKLAFEDSSWEPPPIFGMEPGTPPPPLPARAHTH
jgi:hypothetical protein